MNIKKHIKRSLLWWMPPKLARSILYYRTHKKLLNWKNPCTYDEKIHVLILQMKNKDYSQYVDKFKVYEYVKQCGLERMLIPIIGVYNTPMEINYDMLPERFIIKATHGAGEDYYTICTDKDNLDKDNINKKMLLALKRNFGKEECEYNYYGIFPRLIIQPLLEDKFHKRLTDYKIICIDGKPQCVLVCNNRNEGRDFYSIEWEYLEYVKEEYRSDKKIEKPKCLEEMISAASILSQPFTLARIDFYILNDRIYFGEITLTPSAGCHGYLNDKGQIELGKAITLPEKKKGGIDSAT